MGGSGLHNAQWCNPDSGVGQKIIGSTVCLSVGNLNTAAENGDYQNIGNLILFVKLTIFITIPELILSGHAAK